MAGTADNTFTNRIQKHSYTSDGNSTDAGDLLHTVIAAGGLTDGVGYGWMAGGWRNTSPQGRDEIQKFQFSTDGNSTDIANLIGGTNYLSTAQSQTYGYAAGGGNNTRTTVIQKWAFVSTSNATDVGDLTVAKNVNNAGSSSATHGFKNGGEISGGVTNIIDKWSFSSDGNATDHGDLSVARYGSGSSSTDYGFTAGGEPDSNVIDRYAFASNVTATDWGDMLTNNKNHASTSGTTHSYNMGGHGHDGSIVNVIEKFPHASNAGASDVGNLLATSYSMAPTQY